MGVSITIAGACQKVIKNKKDIDFYIEFQDLFTRRKQKEAIEKGIY